MGQFNTLFQQSIEQPEEFWADAAEGIDWIKKWDNLVEEFTIDLY
jgi:propionyl-CoA synthetase